MGVRQRKSKPKSAGAAAAARKHQSVDPSGDADGWDDDDQLLADAASSNALPPPWTRLPPPSLLVACLVSALLLYANANANGWALDDFSAVANNHDVVGSTPLWPDLFHDDFWGTPMESDRSHKSYRPLTAWNFRANAVWCGGTEGPNAAGCFHRWNWALYALCAVVAAVALDSVSSARASAAAPVARGGAGGRKKTTLGSMPQINWYLVTASAVFVWHPIHTEAVASVVGRADVLAGMAAFAAFVCHRRYLDDRMASATKSPKSSALGLLYVATIVLSWVAALCKETGITTLAICGAQEMAAIWIPVVLARPAKPEPKRRALRSELGPSVARFLGLALAGVAYLALRSDLSGSTRGGLSVQIASFLDNPLLFAPTTMSRVLTALHIQALYFWRLVWPFDLLCEYGFDVVPLVRGFDDPRNALTVLWVAGMVGLAVLGVRRAAAASPGSSAPDPRVLVALAWIVAPLLPASHVVDIGTVLAERLLFTPSLGYAMLVGIGAERWIEGAAYHRGGGDGATSAAAAGRGQKQRAIATAIGLGVVLLFFGSEIVERNADWFSNRSLWEATYRTHPDNVKISHALADAKLKEGDAATAYGISRANYDRLATLTASQRSSLAQLSVFSILAKSITALARAEGSSAPNMTAEAAAAILDEAAVIVEARNFTQKHDFSVYLTRGEILAQGGEFDAARDWTEKALGIAENVNPTEPDPHCLHGTLLMSTGALADGVLRLERCIELWEARSNDPREYADALENMGKAYFSSGRYADAEEFLSRAMAIREVEQTMKLLGAARQKLKQAQEAKDAAAGEAKEVPASD